MKGVRFGDYHSYDDFSLILNSKTIDSPEPKITTVEIPGADGVIDITEYFGETKYKNRKLSFDFSTIIPQRGFLHLFSEIQNTLHGKKVRIVLDDDPNFYYVGRIAVSEWKADRNIGKITVDCDCEPYKYRIYKTVMTVPAGDNTIVLPNLRKRVSPKFHSSGNVVITFNGHEYPPANGDFEIPTILLRPGNNEITLSGAECRIEYQEGGF